MASANNALALLPMIINTEEAKLACHDTLAAIYAVRDEMGAGLNEYIYQEALEAQLQEMGIPYMREKQIHPSYHGKPLKAEYRLDFLINNLIIIECKAIDKIGKNQAAQLFNYLHLTKYSYGILVNFSPCYMEIERFIYDADSDKIFGFDGEEVTTYYKKHIR